MNHELYKALQSLRTIQTVIHETAKSKGWWDGETRNQGELVALIHSEASELLEGLRHGNPVSDHIPPFRASEEELADIIIRCFDMAEAYAWNLPEAIAAKMAFNNTRERKHGGKAF